VLKFTFVAKKDKKLQGIQEPREADSPEDRE
jgi:hypothetical protein